MSENRLPDYLDHIQQAATDVPDLAGNQLHRLSLIHI